MAELTALALTCSLRRSPTPSSSDLMARHVLAELESHGVLTSSLRVVDYNVMPGVQTDMGEGDAWPGIRKKSSRRSSWFSPRLSGWAIRAASPSG